MGVQESCPGKSQADIGLAHEPLHVLKICARILFSKRMILLLFRMQQHARPIDIIKLIKMLSAPDPA